MKFALSLNVFDNRVPKKLCAQISSKIELNLDNKSSIEVNMFFLKKNMFFGN